MATGTTKYGLQKPAVGADTDVWGSHLNNNLDDTDVLFGAISTTGSSNAYVLTTGLSLAAYVSGQSFIIKPNFANTGAATINVDSLGAKDLRKNGTTALASGDLATDQYYRIVYNGTQFQVVGLLAAGVYQPIDATLTALAALSYTSGTLVVTMTAADTFALVSDALYAHLAGSETFTGSKTFSGAIAATFSAATPRTDFYQTGAGSDAKRWSMLADTGVFYLQTRTDADAFGAAPISITRSGTTVTSIALAATAFTFNSAAVRTAGKTAIPIPASAMVPNTTNGAASGTTETSTNKVMVRTLDFDTTTQEGAQFCIPMPKSWNESTVTFEPVWTASAGTAADTVVWELRAVALSNDDALDTAWGTGQTSSDALIATNDVHIGPESSAITIAGTPAEGDLVFFQIRRNVASDNLPNDAKLIAVRLYVTTNAANDA